MIYLMYTIKQDSNKKKKTRHVFGETLMILENIKVNLKYRENNSFS